MIRLHKIDGNEILLNDFLIKEVLDVDGITEIVLSEGERLLVKNSQTDILTKIDASKLCESD